jgi:hypothetical protein
MWRTIIIIFFLFNLTLKAQVVFCPPGAEWHYKVTHCCDAGVDNESLKYVRDSIFMSKTVKLIQHQRDLNQCGSILTQLSMIRKSNDSVFLKNPETFNNWELLYVYSALPGQSWTFNIKNGDASVQTYTVVVDSINYKTINSYSLKYLKVRYKTSKYSTLYIYNSTITERFGDEAFLFNFSQKESVACGTWWIGGALCYQDSSSFGIKQFTSLSCNYSNPLSINVYSENKVLNVFPNPASNILNISYEAIEFTNSEIELVNYLGQTVLTLPFSHTLDISALSNGYYSVKISTLDNQHYYSKFVKN